jgi:peroxin-19
MPIPTGPQPNESEEAFLARLQHEMSDVMSKMSLDPAASAATPEDIAKMGKELEEFTQKMEAEGIQPEDLLKALLGEDAGGKLGQEAHKERDRRESQESKSKSRSPETSRTGEKEKPTTSTSSSTTSPKPAASFESTIRSTLSRMDQSSAQATTQSQTQSQQSSEEAMLAEMLRSLGESSGADGTEDEGEISKMFLGMMEQLTHKEMLYEPMKELSEKFPSYLSTNNPSTNPKSKISKDEFERFQRQQKIVNEIVGKFEEKGYSDDKPEDRSYIWEKMQEMQGEGAPPEDLVANPFPGMGGGLGNLGGLLGGEGGEGGEEGCPTQ